MAAPRGKHRAMVCKVCMHQFAKCGGLFLPCVHGGQWKLGRAGDYCLSQRGPAAGVEDAAERGAITASSTADAVAHGANMAVDGSSSTFWVRLFSHLGIGASRFLLTSSFEG